MLSLYASSTALTRAPVVRMSTESPARAALWKPGEVAPAHLTGEMAGDADQERVARERAEQKAEEERAAKEEAEERCQQLARKLQRKILQN